MQIRKILQQTQPDAYRELKKLQPRKRKRRKKKKGPRQVKVTRSEIRECMGHGAWKRGKGGAIRQFRW